MRYARYLPIIALALFTLFSTSLQAQITLPSTVDFDSETNNTPSTNCGYNPAAMTNGDWNNTGGDDIQWITFSGPTGSTGTGPAADNTSGSGLFAYLEGSGGASCYNQTGILLSDAIDATTLPDLTLEFVYHMYTSTGADMGDLFVDVSTNGGSTWVTGIWSRSGNQGNVWNTGTVNLTPYIGFSNVRVRFRGVTGTGFRSDIALDDITLSSSGGGAGPCFTEDFSGGLPAGWASSSYSSGIDWSFGTSASIASTSNLENDWFWTDALALNGGTTYTISYDQTSIGSCFEDARWQVLLTTAQNNSSTVGAPIATFSTCTAGARSHTFTPPSTGTYYIAFRAYSDDFGNGLTIDNIELSGCTVPSACPTTGGAMAGTYTVDAGGGGDFLTIQCAVDNLEARGISAPVQIDIAAGSGPYNEAVVFNGPITGTSATDTILFNGNGETVEFAVDGTNSSVILIQDADYVTFDDFELDATAGTSFYSNCIRFADNADNCRISNSTLRGSPTVTSANFNAALVLILESSAAEICNNTEIINNTFNDGSKGIFVNSNELNENILVRGNTFSSQYVAGIDILDASDVFIENNIVSPEGSPSTLEGIVLDDVSGTFRVTGNTVLLQPTGGAFAYGIVTDYATGTSGNRGIIANNFVTVTGAAVSNAVYGIYNRSNQANYIDAIFNNVYIDNGAPESGALRTLSDLNSEYRVYNNNFVNVSAGGHAMLIEAGFGGTPAEAILGLTDANYNNLYTTGGDPVVEVEGDNYNTLADWQAATYGYDANSISVDPIYTDVSTGDLHVDESLLQVGNTTTGITVDIDGDTRRPTPTIGADEIECLIAAGTMSGTYTVDATGAGDFETIQCACENIMARDVSGPVIIQMEDDTYNEQVQIDGSGLTGPSTTNTITFRSASGDPVNVTVTNNTSTISDNYTWRVRDLSHVRFENLTIENASTGTYQRVIHIEALTGAVQNIRLEGNVLRGAPNPAVSGNNANLEFDHRDHPFQNVDVINNTINGGSIGIYFAAAFGANSQDVFISGNTFRNAGGLSVINLQEVNDFIVESNDILITNDAGSAARAINMVSNSTVSQPRNLVYNNFIVEQGITTTDLRLLDINNSDDLGIYYNSIRINNGSDPTSTAIYVVNNTSTGLDIRNNAIQNDGPGYLIRLFPFTTPLPTVTCDFNNLFANGGGNVGEYSGTDYATLGAWQGTFGNDANSMSANPGFLSTTNLRIDGASPMLDQATPLTAVTFDIDGDVRNPDIGADEFVSPLPVALIGFRAKLTDAHDVQLDWSSAQELNSSHFVIERRHGSGQFIAVDERPAAGKSNRSKVYDYLDVQPPSGQLYYRLRMVDLDGTAEYSRTVNVLIAEDGQLLMQAYPNPASDVLNLNFGGLSPKSVVDVQLIDAAGRLALQRSYAYREGLVIGVPMQQLSSGLYTLRVNAAGEQLIERIVKQ